MKPLTAERLRELIAYDKDAGSFVWISGRNKGRVCGWVWPSGYQFIKIEHQVYRAHRLAWLYVHGEWPSQVDHRNGNRLDNRLENLRNGDNAVNQQNLRAARSNNKTGFLGVFKANNKVKNLYRAVLRDPIKKKTLHLGDFATPEEAHSVYLQAKRMLHPGCTI